MNNSNAHNELVRTALEELAKAGYCAWKTGTGAYKTDTGGFIKYGKKGGADITMILPRKLINLDGNWIIIGQHVEAEAKTGAGRQNKNQEGHQKYAVERNGGVYILFRTVEELLCQVKQIG